MALTLKIQFNNELEMGDWGPFCKRHNLLGGISDFHMDHWISMRTNVPYVEVDKIIRDLNLDPIVRRAWITKQEEEAE